MRNVPPKGERTVKRDVKVRRRASEQEKRPLKGGEPHDRVERLVSSGMPYQMAVAVVQGRMALNDAVERLARRAEVDRLMREHGLSRALATQVVLGHADLDAYLTKRRFEEHRAEHLQRSILDEAIASGQRLVFGLFDGRRIEARVLSTTTYQAIVQEEGGEPLVLHKLEFK